MSRKLATLRIISELIPIEGADKIEIAKVDFWKVVVRKGEFNIGSLVVYFEIDSWIPSSLAPFLTKKGSPKIYNGIKGEKLKTVKLKGQISQGLIMNISDVTKIYPDFESRVSIQEGVDITEILNIQKWEEPVSSFLSASNMRPKGNFPEFIPKTDQERIQNLTKKFGDIKSQIWEITEKYDGSSMTVYYFNHNDEIKEGVCSRNLELKMETENGINAYWEIAIREKLLEKLRKIGRNIAIQGELIGHKINNNIYKMNDKDFYIFDVYDIDSQHYLDPMERQTFVIKHDFKHVPVLYNNYKFSEEVTVEDILNFAEGKSCLNDSTEREGPVFKNMNNQQSFKAISNRYLLS